MGDEWIGSLVGKIVVINGQVIETIHKDEAEQLVRDLGGIPKRAPVTANVDVLVRGSSPRWKDGFYGREEERLAALQRKGSAVKLIDAWGLWNLQAGLQAPVLEPFQPAPVRLGAPYKPSLPPSITDRWKVLEPNPELYERGLAAHTTTQNALAEAIIQAGLTPLSPTTFECYFDVAWQDGRSFWVSEVKSMTKDNEIGQLRLAIGQVLDYAQRLRRMHQQVIPVIAVEKAPTAQEHWIATCASHGIRLVWPETMSTLFAKQARRGARVR